MLEGIKLKFICWIGRVEEMTCKYCKYYKNGYCKLWDIFTKEGGQCCEDGEEE